ncbi:unnamed protein product [Protopolystoma xenopodis]|uniref:Tetraspanin n=1 Tax=Protopolystoma xenopodis TaxID=117903 RepID=A0A3S5CKL1_9PLAT|nr:unnamed protein product [Protopolystoma xenopodis]
MLNDLNLLAAMSKSCDTCLVVVLLTFNVILLFIGASILGFSIFCYLHTTVQSAISRSGYSDLMQNLLYSLTGVGSLTIIVALFGCCGAYHESSCLLGTYLICLGIVFSVEVAVAILGMVFRTDTENRIILAVDKVIHSFYSDSKLDENSPDSTHRSIIQKWFLTLLPQRLASIIRPFKVMMLDFSGPRKTPLLKNHNQYCSSLPDHPFLKIKFIAHLSARRFHRFEFCIR